MVFGEILEIWYDKKISFIDEAQSAHNTSVPTLISTLNIHSSEFTMEIFSKQIKLCLGVRKAHCHSSGTQPALAHTVQRRFRLHLPASFSSSAVIR